MHISSKADEATDIQQTCAPSLPCRVHVLRFVDDVKSVITRAVAIFVLVVFAHRGSAYRHKIKDMNAIAPVTILYKPAGSHWSHKHHVDQQQANTLILNPGDTLTFQRFESPDQRRFGFYLPMEYWDGSWQQARAVFDGDYRLDSVNLKRQPEGCYRITFYNRVLAGNGAINAAAILANIRSLAPANVATHASNGCPYYTLQYS